MGVEPPDEADTPDYPAGSERYRYDEDDDDFERKMVATARRMQMYPPELSDAEIWKRLGGTPGAPPETDSPAVDLPERGRTPSPYVKQVNIKLSPECFAGLEELAESYGVATSTMARMLVARGVKVAGFG
jgi:hypothetical protein